MINKDRKRYGRSNSIKRFPNKHLASLPISRIIPNVLTLMSLCIGFSGIRFALAEKWQITVACVIGAAILDGTDGRVARLLNSSSQFGAELDSLSDFIAFGASPAFIMYLFSLNTWGAYGWVFCLFFVVCSILRLARFNIQAGNCSNIQPWEKKFFTGVPMPFGALLCLTPIILNVEYNCAALFRSPYICAFSMTFSGVLMISRIKTFSFKTLKISQKLVLPVMLGSGLVIAFLTTELWSTLIVIITIYLALIPISMRRYKTLSEALMPSVVTEDNVNTP